MAALTWLSCSSALPFLKSACAASKPRSGTSASNPEPKARGDNETVAERTTSAKAESYADRLAKADTQALARAIDREAIRRMRGLVAGISRYQSYPYDRPREDATCCWRAGGARLFDYGGPPDARPVLLVPSLINRAYILDLKPGRSLVGMLRDQGLRPFLVDWGAPGVAERDFTLDDYLRQRLEPAFAVVRARSVGRKPLLVGYCMGGLLATALAVRYQAALAGLALLATPWDFHSDGGAMSHAATAAYSALRPMLARRDILSVDIIQSWFGMMAPFSVVGKFSRFGEHDAERGLSRDFVAVEDWLNDGVPLTTGVARECLEGWYRDNLPARGLWKAADTVVRPQSLEIPSLHIIPRRDRIVPPASAAALARAMPGAQTHSVSAGHIGMIVGNDAPEQVWRPLAGWMRAAA